MVIAIRMEVAQQSVKGNRAELRLQTRFLGYLFQEYLIPQVLRELFYIKQRKHFP